MIFQFRCPRTGHEVETAFEVDDDELMLLRANGLRTQCSFCGASHEWVFVANEQGKDRGVRRKSRPSLSGRIAR
jgi:hypothetical protein